MKCRCATQACGHCRARNGLSVDRLVAAAEALRALDVLALADAPTHRRLEPRHDITPEQLRELGRLAAPLAAAARRIFGARDELRERRRVSVAAWIAGLERSGWADGRKPTIAELHAARRGPRRATTTTTTAAKRRAGG